MLFQNISDRVIKLAQIQAKWQGDQQRRYLANFALDMYNGLYLDYLNKMIEDMTSKEGDQDELKKYVSSLDTLADIVKDISLVFAEKPEISVTVNNKINENYTLALNEILDDADWYVILNELNRMTNLFFDMTAVPVTRDGGIQIDLITPDRSFIYNGDFDPTTAETFFYLIGELPNSQKNAVRTDIYMACNRAGKKLVTVKPGYGNNGKPLITDYTGDGYKDFIDETNYPCQPAVMFRNYMPLSSFWHPGLNPLVEAALDIDRMFTEYSMAIGYQLPLLVSIGLNDANAIVQGRKSRINIPPSLGGTSGDVKYVTPDQMLTELGKQIYDRIEHLKLSYKLSKSVISGQTATSGYELMLSKAEILSWNKKQQKFYVKPIQQLCQCVMALANKYRIATFAENCEVDIKFGVQKFIETPAEKIDRQSKELMSGLRNLVDIEIENSDGVLSRKEALEIIKARKEENKTLAAISAPVFTQTKFNNQSQENTEE